MHEAVAEIVCQRVAIGVDDVALRLFQSDVADGGQRAGALIVDNLIGGQDVIIVKDLNVAARDDAIASGVIDELIALQLHRLSAVEFLFDVAEHSAFGFRKRTG